MKWKVMLVTYGQPLLAAVIILVTFYWVKDAWLWLAAVAGVILREFFSTRYYVTNITVSGNLLEMYCITNKLGTTRLHFAITDTSNIQLGILKNWFDCTAGIAINENGTKKIYYIIDKGIYQQIEMCLPNSYTNITTMYDFHK